MFLNIWNSFIQTEDDYSKFRPHVHHPQPFDSDGIVQPFSDTPLDDENLGENVYLEIINQAEDYVYIYTPYLILDNENDHSTQACIKKRRRRKTYNSGNTRQKDNFQAYAFLLFASN